MIRVIAVVACGLALAACSSGMPSWSPSWSSSMDFLPKFDPKPVAMQFESEPAGAEAKTSTGQTCRTPCTLSVAPNKEFSVTFALAGYQPQTIPVKVGKPEGAYDDSIGLTPNPVYAELEAAKPAPKRAPAKPAPKPATAAAPKPAAAPAASSPWPMPR